MAWRVPVGGGLRGDPVLLIAASLAELELRADAVLPASLDNGWKADSKVALVPQGLLGGDIPNIWARVPKGRPGRSVPDLAMVATALGRVDQVSRRDAVVHVEHSDLELVPDALAVVVLLGDQDDVHS